MVLALAQGSEVALEPVLLRAQVREMVQVMAVPQEDFPAAVSAPA